MTLIISVCLFLTLFAGKEELSDMNKNFYPPHMAFPSASEHHVQPLIHQVEPPEHNSPRVLGVQTLWMICFMTLVAVIVQLERRRKSLKSRLWINEASHTREMFDRGNMHETTPDPLSAFLTNIPFSTNKSALDAIKMGRQPCCEKNGLRRGPWTVEEDHKLMTFILNNGIQCWRIVPKLAGLMRCGKSCRLRWINYLRPDLKRGAFTEAEEDMIIQLHSRLGNRWSKIAAQFPGRTDNEIKNHWNTRIKKKMKFMGLDPRTHHPVGQHRNLDPIMKRENGESTSSHNVFNNHMIKEENPGILNDNIPTVEDIGLMMMSNNQQLESLSPSFEFEFPQNWNDNPGFQWDVFNDPGLGFH